MKDEQCKFIAHLYYSQGIEGIEKKFNVSIRFVDLSPLGIYGCLTKRDRFYEILIDKNLCPEDKVITLFHELFHLLNTHDKISTLPQLYSSHEYKANYFAKRTFYYLKQLIEQYGVH